MRTNYQHQNLKSILQKEFSIELSQNSKLLDSNELALAYLFTIVNAIIPIVNAIITIVFFSAVLPIVNVFAVFSIVNNSIPIVNEITELSIVNNNIPIVNNNISIVPYFQFTISLLHEVFTRGVLQLLKNSYP